MAASSASKSVLCSLAVSQGKAPAFQPLSELLFWSGQDKAAWKGWGALGKV